tara:strand:+ start:569 stop:952 length:384 start_codon:yes stop_codon:yes gene_type:complete
MIFEIRIYEHWLDNPGLETGSIKSIDLFQEWDYRSSYAYGLFCDLVSDNDGLWKKKKFIEVDGSWGEVVVKKTELDYFYDETNKRYFNIDKIDDLTTDEQKELYMTGKKKLEVLDENKWYRLVAVES